ncbi:hypothetical protein LCGC14_0744680 [marine sediment metagenome]|uniref:Uncharacterized protein n=1 Tax=marine sediment metagenome TaxID=412755 RepID=A0A0F9SQT5_9ZZZZ|nr:hypothetical protein [bacterium]
MMNLKSKGISGAVIIVCAILLPILFISITNEFLIQFETLPGNSFKRHESETFYVINSEEEYLSIARDPSKSPPPSIDFTQFTVIAVFGGVHGSGSNLEITKLQFQGSKILVYYKIELYVTAVLSYPGDVVKTQKLEGEFEFIKT